MANLTFRLVFAYPEAMSLALPSAWVVTCTGCGCTVTCQATDPQGEHTEPDRVEAARPREARVVTCSCCWQAYRYEAAHISKGEPKPSVRCAARRQARNGQGKVDGALLVAASVVAAVRLNREEIQNSPKVQSAIGGKCPACQDGPGTDRGG